MFGAIAACVVGVLIMWVALQSTTIPFRHVLSTVVLGAACVVCGVGDIARVMGDPIGSALILIGLLLGAGVLGFYLLMCVVSVFVPGRTDEPG